MNKVDERVCKNIAAFPMLFDNRFDVLHHIFCVNGNGYDWVNGEPFESYSADKRPWRPEDDYATASKYAESMPRWVDFMFESIAENQAIIDTLDARVADFSFENSRQKLAGEQMRQVMGPEYGPLYQQTEYALLMNLPADIHPDWAAAAVEMRAIAETMNWKF